MTTNQLLSYTYALERNQKREFTIEERNDRRRTLKRILKNTKFNIYTDEELDKITLSQQSDGHYLITDINGYEWSI